MSFEMLPQWQACENKKEVSCLKESCKFTVLRVNQMKIIAKQCALFIRFLCRPIIALINEEPKWKSRFSITFKDDHDDACTLHALCYVIMAVFSQRAPTRCFCAGRRWRQCSNTEKKHGGKKEIFPLLSLLDAFMDSSHEMKWLQGPSAPGFFFLSTFSNHT